MNNKEMKKYINNYYWANNQLLKLTSNFEAIEGSYWEQIIFLKDNILCYIQTWDMLKYTEDIAHTPYCIKTEDGWQITVPKFGDLTKEDIIKAIYYIVYQGKYGLIFNIELDKEPIYYNNLVHNYGFDISTLRSLNENRN